MQFLRRWLRVRRVRRRVNTVYGGRSFHRVAGPKEVGHLHGVPLFEGPPRRVADGVGCWPVAAESFRAVP